MATIWIGMLQISFERLKYIFELECFESLSNGLNLHLNASNPFQMVRICIWIPFKLFKFGFECFQVPFEWFEFLFECFESLTKDPNLDLNASNPILLVRICNWILQIPFEWLEFAFNCFESLSNNSNLHLSASNPFRMVKISIQMLWILFEWFQFGLEWFESFFNG